MMFPFMFTSWQAFFAMGGYSLYVWSAFLITVALFATLFLSTLWQRHCLRRTLRYDLLRQRIQLPQQEHSEG